MTSLVDRVLPYLKASVNDAGGPILHLSSDSSPVLEPYVGTLLISYVVDHGSSLRLITEGDRRTSGLSPASLRQAALANLARTIESRAVRLAPHGNILAVLFDGNLEATLLLWDDLWTHVQLQLGPHLIAVAPARDVLAVAPPTGVNELRDVIARVWPNGDHLLTRDVYQRAKDRWAIYEPE